MFSWWSTLAGCQCLLSCPFANLFGVLLSWIYQNVVCNNGSLTEHFFSYSFFFSSGITRTTLRENCNNNNGFLFSVCVCVMRAVCGQLIGVNSPFPPCEFWGLVINNLTCWAISLAQISVFSKKLSKSFCWERCLPTKPERKCCLAHHPLLFKV